MHEPIHQDATAMGVVGMTVGECRYIFEDGIICGVVDTTVPSFFRTETRRSVCDWTARTVDFWLLEWVFTWALAKKGEVERNVGNLLTFSVGELTKTCRSVHLDLYICQAFFNECLVPTIGFTAAEDDRLIFLRFRSHRVK